MTQPLTPQQLALVASTVTGLPFENMGPEGIIYSSPPGTYGSQAWYPRFVDNDSAGNEVRDPHRRSQALALVEWLAVKLMNGSKFIKYSANIEFISAIEKRDINALQRLVLELKGAAQ
jgi:hypothetical protein